MQRSLFLLTLIAVAHGLYVGLSGNVTLSNIDEFKFRATETSSINVLVYNGASLTSVAVDASKSAAQLDIVYASVTTSILSAPSTYVSYFDANVAKNGSNPFTGILFSAAAAFMSNTYLRINEVDEGGNVVQTKSLVDAYTVTDSNLQDGGVSSITLKYVTLLGSFSFQLTSVFTNKVGTLNVTGSPLITPKSVETVIQISGWSYTNTANRLMLVMGIGSLSVSASGSATFSAGADATGVFFTLSESALVDGSTGSVSISGLGTITASDFGNADLAAQVSLKYGANASFKTVNVTFPAGAKSITYDPSIGAGANPPSSATTIGLFSALLLALLF